MQTTVIMEKDSTTGPGPYTREDLNHFSIARTNKELHQKASDYIEPVTTTAQPVVSEALKIEALFN